MRQLLFTFTTLFALASILASSAAATSNNANISIPTSSLNSHAPANGEKLATSQKLDSNPAEQQASTNPESSKHSSSARKASEHSSKTETAKSGLGLSTPKLAPVYPAHIKRLREFKFTAMDHNIPEEMAIVYMAAGSYEHVDPRLLAAIGRMESDHARSRLPGVHSGLNSVGCCAGPAQICITDNCLVWQTYAGSLTNIYDPWQAFTVAARYLRVLSTLVGNQPHMLLAAYNSGPGTVRRYGGIPPYRETQNYVAKGMAIYNSLPRLSDRVLRRARGQ